MWLCSSPVMSRLCQRAESKISHLKLTFKRHCLLLIDDVRNVSKQLWTKWIELVCGTGLSVDFLHVECHEFDYRCQFIKLSIPNLLMMQYEKKPTLCKLTWEWTAL